MMRDEAVQRINDALGFRPEGNPLEVTIVKRLQEAQRDLEKGKTLPKFLLQEDQTFTLAGGSTTVPLPAGFLRLDDDNLPHFTSPEFPFPVFMRKMNYSDAVYWVTRTRRVDLRTDSVVPAIFVLRKGSLDFIARADTSYNFVWNYYKADDLLISNIENQWLKNVPEWLIGEAGFRISSDARDQVAQQLFDDMRQRARAAFFGDRLQEEESGGPFIMAEFS